MNEKNFTDKEKLAQMATFYGLSFAEFSRKLGVKNQEMYQLKSGKQSYFSHSTLEKITKNCPEISLYWLITGEGSMLAGNVEHHNAAAIDHSTATVIHSEAPAANADYDGLITSQQQTIERLTKIIDNLTSK